MALVLWNLERGGIQFTLWKSEVLTLIPQDRLRHLKRKGFSVPEYGQLRMDGDRDVRLLSFPVPSLRTPPQGKPIILVAWSPSLCLRGSPHSNSPVTTRLRHSSFFSEEGQLFASRYTSTPRI